MKTQSFGQSQLPKKKKKQQILKAAFRQINVSFEQS